MLTHAGVPVQTNEWVEHVQRNHHGFEIVTRKDAYRARWVVLAIGKRVTPRRLGVPGKDLAKVSYRLIEADSYQDQHLLENFEGAVAALRKAVELGPTLPEPPYTLAVIFWQQGKLDEAAVHLRRAIAIRRDYEAAHYILGAVLRQKGEIDAAIEELQTALQLDPKDAGAHQALATACRQKGDLARAVEESRQAETLNKARANTLSATLATNTGSSKLRKGDLQGALEQFHAALKLAPDYAPAHYHMGLALRQKGDAALAEAEFERAHQLDPRLRPPRE